MDSILALRCFGKFRWPPLQKERGTQPSQHGVVEIWYLKGDGDTWLAHLRWRPGRIDLQDVLETGEFQNAHELTPEQLRNLFASNISVTLALSNGGSAADKPPLRFEGISVFDQHGLREKDGQKEQVHALRLPLLASLDRPKEPQLWSTLQIGNGDRTDGIRLEAIVPLPFASNGSQVGQTAHFAFSAIFSPRIKAADITPAGLSLNTLTFGPRGEGVRVKPPLPVLGQIGWSPFFDTERVSGGTEALTEKTDSYWGDAAHLLQQVLPGFGCAPVFVKPAKAPANFDIRTDYLAKAGMRRFPAVSFEATLTASGAPTSGQVEGIALGPLGGDADQTVRFCGDRIAIITETRNGHIQRQRVEVVGRIAVWWHRAKHVVIYERTVNPSAQFTPEGGIGTRSRRPVLRKVREFIELLQPERRYPDAEGAAASSNAFVQGVRFNSSTIPVDSLWGADVGTHGWKVPLWNRHAARQRPQVYAMPDVAFLLASEGSETDAITSQGCLNPDNLYFFASTRPEATADTDRWPQELSIDWVNLPPPASTKSLEPTQKDKHEHEPEASVPNGFAGFTWRLAPAAQRTTINQWRGKRPVYAALRTLTFMRAGRVADPEHTIPDRPQPVLPWCDPWLPGKAINEGPPALVALSRVIAERLPEQAGDGDAVRARIAALRASLNDLQAPAFVDALEHRRAGLDTARQRVADAAQAAIGNGDLAALINGDGCKAWKRNLEGSIRAKRLAIGQELQAWERDFARKVDGWVTNHLNDLTSDDWLRKALSQNIQQALRPIFEGATASIGQADRGCELARDALETARGRLRECIAQARAEVAAIHQGIDQDKPWSEQRLGDLKSHLDTAMVKAADDVRGVFAEACDRLTAELDEVSRQVGAATSAVLRNAAVTDVLVQQPWRTGMSRLTQVYDPIKAALKEAQASLDKARTQVEGQRKAIEPIKAGLTDTLLAALEDIHQATQDASTSLASIALSAERVGEEVSAAAKQLQKALQDASLATSAWTASLADALQEKADLQPILGAFTGAIDAAQFKLDELATFYLQKASDGAKQIDIAIGWIEGRLDGLLDLADVHVHGAATVLEAAIGNLSTQLANVRKKLEPDQITQHIADGLLDLGKELIGQIGIPPQSTPEHARERLLWFATTWRERASNALETPQVFMADLLSGLDGACKWFEGAAGALDRTLQTSAETIIADIKKSEFYKSLGDLDAILSDAKRYAVLVENFKSLESDIRQVGNDLAQSGEALANYADKATRAIGDVVSGGLQAAPGNILRAMAAIGSGPDLPNLDSARRQLGYYYGLVDEVVNTTPVKACLGRLGDSLKAWGVTLPFNSIGDRLLPMDLSQFDIGQIFNRCGGLDLQRLFKGCKLPSGVSDAVRLSHDFNRETFRAWVQLDVDAAVPGRQTLLSVGPFCLNAIDTRIVGRVRLEASKDSDRVEDEGVATLHTDFEAVISGQVMVTLRDVSVNFSKGGGLKVDFDPKKVELNRNLQFIQNSLGSIFGDELGGMTVIKQDGVPVGLEHLFSMPPMSLMCGTSGVQNIQISNQFQLIAYPDFRLSNRFSLARPELPFIFSIFIVGGTGWLSVDLDYRPFGDELMVVVEAAVGGSASLGFAFAGCTGSVAITLAAALTYRKLIGQAGGGLTVSMVVTIIGVVDVLRIASAHLCVELRLSYADSGTINASGRFKLEIRISRFFKVTAQGDASYQMAGGQRQSSSRIGVDAKPTPEAERMAQYAREKADRLLKGQGSLNHG